jgi:glyceraldehyde 3-phosphate dehydrogenase
VKEIDGGIEVNG